MKLINIASGNSAWRGLEYYNEHKVYSFNRINENQYEGIIEGNNKKARTIKVRADLLLEQVMGIGPTWSAWKAEVLPLNYTCIALIIILIFLYLSIHQYYFIIKM